MGKLMAVCAAWLLVAVVASAADPAPPSKPVPERWEYCEIVARGTPVRVGAVQPAAQGAVRMITGEQEIEAASWEELATKLKMPDAKKDVPASTHKLRVLNFLGEQGWELVSAQQTSTAVTSPTNLLFKRKVAK